MFCIHAKLLGNIIIRQSRIGSIKNNYVLFCQINVLIALARKVIVSGIVDAWIPVYASSVWVIIDRFPERTKTNPDGARWVALCHN